MHLTEIKRDVLIMNRVLPNIYQNALQLFMAYVQHKIN